MAFPTTAALTSITTVGSFPVCRFGSDVAPKRAPWLTSPGPMGIYVEAVTSGQAASETPLLDEWRAQLGDEDVAAVVRRARDQIASGSLPGFSDKLGFLDYVRELRRRSA
jgi:hypothetical protein